MLKHCEEKWFLWVDTARHPAMNMAIDEELLLLSDSVKIPILRFYSWDRPSMSIGYSQSYENLIDSKHFLVRRPTGGGVVFHDIDLTYTIVIPSGHKIEKLKREKSYYLFHALLIKALHDIGLDTKLVRRSKYLKERSIMQCFSAPVKFDIALKNSNNFSSSKVAGAAQRRTNNGILHQGSIVVPEIDKQKKALIDSIISVFCTRLGLIFLDFIACKAFLDRAESLAISKYKTKLWNQRKQ